MWLLLIRSDLGFMPYSRIFRFFICGHYCDERKSEIARENTYHNHNMQAELDFTAT